MRKFLPILFAVVLFSSHDMYLKLDSYFLAPASEATIKLFNGTFAKSDNVIARNRMANASMIGNGKRMAIDSAKWSEQDKTTLLTFTTGEPGTWVAGVSTYARNIEMDGEAFNRYLEHDGIPDMLEWRKENDALDKPAVEKYSKHVKTIFQVGDKRTFDWNTPLGYPIEFIPRLNPYSLKVGNELRVQLLWKGEPLADQIVTIDSEPLGHSHGSDHDHGAEANHAHDEGQGHTHGGENQIRTNKDGEFNVDLDQEGVYFLRTIRMVASDEPGLTHESNWATLTFEIGHGHTVGHAHDHGDGMHSHGGGAPHSHGDGDHTHDGEGGVPSYIFWIASLALIGVMFFIFNRKEA